MTAPKLAEIRKALAALAGLIAQVIALGLLHGTALHVTQIVAGAVASLLVFLVPNATPKATAPVVPPTAPKV